MLYHNKSFKEYMRKKRATDKPAKTVELTLAELWNLFKRVTIRENVVTKEAAALW